MHIWFWLTAFTAHADDPATTGPPTNPLIEAFSGALASKRWEVAKSQCSPAFRTRARLNCDKLVDMVEAGAVLSYESYDGPVSTWTVTFRGQTIGVFLKAGDTPEGRRFVDGWDADTPSPMGNTTATHQVPLEPVEAQILDALNQANETALSALCTPAQQQELEGMASQVTRKGLSFGAIDVSRGEQRRAITASVFRDGEEIDRIWMYLEKHGQAWLLAHIDEEPSHAELFVKGKLPAQPPASGTKAPKALSALATKTTKELRGSDSALPPIEARWLEELRSTKIPEPVLYWYDGLPAALICYPGETDSKLLIAVPDGDSWIVKKSRITYRSGCIATFRHLLNP